MAGDLVFRLTSQLFAKGVRITNETNPPALRLLTAEGQAVATFIPLNSLLARQYIQDEAQKIAAARFSPESPLSQISQGTSPFLQFFGKVPFGEEAFRHGLETFHRWPTEEKDLFAFVLKALLPQIDSVPERREWVAKFQRAVETAGLVWWEPHLQDLSGYNESSADWRKGNREVYVHFYKCGKPSLTLGYKGENLESPFLYESPSPAGKKDFVPKDKDFVRLWRWLIGGTSEKRPSKYP